MRVLRKAGNPDATWWEFIFNCTDEVIECSVGTMYLLTFSRLCLERTSQHLPKFFIESSLVSFLLKLFDVFFTWKKQK